MLVVASMDARKTVLALDEMELWRGITTDMMSDEEDGCMNGVCRWTVRPPSFLANLYAALQARLEADVKYTASHCRHLQSGQRSDQIRQYGRKKI